MDELKPCPFCNGKEVMLYSEHCDDEEIWNVWHECENTRLEINAGFRTTKQEAINAWNNRFTDVSKE